MLKGEFNDTLYTKTVSMTLSILKGIAIASFTLKGVAMAPSILKGISKGFQCFCLQLESVVDEVVMVVVLLDIISV